LEGISHLEEKASLSLAGRGAAAGWRRKEKDYFDDITDEKVPNARLGDSHRRHQARQIRPREI
jgi:hypothetical protein